MNQTSNAEQVWQAWIKALDRYDRQYGERSWIPEQFAYIQFIDACMNLIDYPDFEEQAPRFALFCLDRAHRTHARCVRN